MVDTNKTLKDLQKELTDMGFVGAETFKSKDQVVAVIEALQKKEAKANDAQPAQPAQDVVNPSGNVVDDERGDQKKYFGKAKRMKEYCDSLPKVDFIVPLGIGEKKGAIETWQANGYRLNILKGVRIKLPENVADDLARAYNLTAEAGQEFSLDRPSTDPTSPYKTVRDAVE